MDIMSNSLDLVSVIKSPTKDMDKHKKNTLKAENSLVGDIKRSIYFLKVTRLFEYSIDCSNLLYNYLSNDLAKSIAKTFKGQVLLRLDNVTQMSTYFFKIRSSKKAIQKLDEIMQEFNDIAYNKDHKPKSLQQLQQEKEQLSIILNNKETLKIVKLHKIVKINQELNTLIPSSSSSVVLNTRRSRSKRKGNKINQIPNTVKTIRKLNSQKDTLEKEIRTLNDDMEELTKKLKRMSEYSLVLELKLSNKNRIYTNSIVFVHSLVTFAVNSAVFVISSISTLSSVPFWAVSYNVLLANDLVLRSFKYTTLIWSQIRKIYLNDVNIKRAKILLHKIETLSHFEFLSHARLGKTSLTKSDIELLTKYGLPKNILMDIGKGHIPLETLYMLDLSISKIDLSLVDDNETDKVFSLVNSIKNNISLYKKNVIPVIDSRLGEITPSDDEIKTFNNKFGLTKDVCDLLRSVGNRFITSDEVGILQAEFKRIAQIRSSLSLSEVENQHVDRLLSYFNEQIPRYQKSILFDNDVDLPNLIHNNNYYSIDKSLYEAKHKLEYVLNRNLVTRLSKFNFNSAYSNYILKISEYIDDKLTVSSSFKNSLFHVADDEWGRVWKLFHPYRSDNLTLQASKDNRKFLLNLIDSLDVSFIIDAAKNNKIDWNDQDAINSAYDKYTRTKHVCDYINALAAGNTSKSRDTIFRSLYAYVKKTEEVSEDSALNIIQSQL